LFLPLAYIGPGAGFAVVGSAWIFFFVFLGAIFTIFCWPLVSIWRHLRHRHARGQAKARRVVIVGLDGIDPALVDDLMTEEKLPNLSRLAQLGSYHRLATTIPPISPVAWSSFQTGVNPGAHNIYDFLSRDKRNYLPSLSSSRTTLAKKFCSLGKWRFPLEKSEIRLLRKSQAFWKILGKHGIFSDIIRVPISYPPEKFNGNILAAMCAPDLRGTQGTCSLYTTSSDYQEIDEVTRVSKQGNLVAAELYGPQHPFFKKTAALSVKFTVELDEDAQTALLTIGKVTELLKVGEFSSWISVEFKVLPFFSIKGICRFCLRELNPNFTLYVSPINVDPESPALPISEPSYFANYLAKADGPYGTLGLMEDTWGRNEGALNDQLFLEQTYLTHEEREKMFFRSLSNSSEGLNICVFDASDRIQHIFWRYLDKAHPAPREEGKGFEKVIPEMYQKMDQLVGKVQNLLDENDLLLVLSDHGFTSFRRCVNLNAWLLCEGYLTLKDGEEKSGEYFEKVDWSRTKAFALGLSGIYLNIRDRERNGILSLDQAEQLEEEIANKLSSLKDPQSNQTAVRKVYQSKKVYSGAYTAEAPDLIRIIL